MAKNKYSKPDSEEDILNVMVNYNEKKGFGLSEDILSYFASDCYLLYEAKGWAGCKYYPALAKRYILNYVHGFGKEVKPKPKPKQEGPTVRDKIQRRHQIYEDCW